MPICLYSRFKGATINFLCRGYTYTMIALQGLEGAVKCK